MNGCFFCGPTDSPLTKEHVWPKWVSRLLLGQYNSDHFRHLRAAGDNTTANWRSRYLDVTTKTVCSDCNNKWLSIFENDQIKPLASPLIVGGDAVELTPESQSRLAAWAYKMAMLVEVANPDKPVEFFTPAERLLFRQTTSAHPLVRVFLSRYDFGQRPAHALTPCHRFKEKGSSHKCMHDLAPGRSASAVGRRCGCARARYAAVQSSVAQLTAACAGPALGGGPARRQPDQTQAADSMALTWRRTVKDSGTRPRLSPMFCAGAERSLTVQPPWNGQPVTIPVSGVAGLSGSPQLLSRYRRCSLVT